MTATRQRYSRADGRPPLCCVTFPPAVEFVLAVYWALRDALCSHTYGICSEFWEQQLSGAAEYACASLAARWWKAGIRE